MTSEPGVEEKPAIPGGKGRSLGTARKLLWALLLTGGLAVLGFFIYRGIQTRVHAESALVNETRESAIPTVSVIHPKQGSPADELVLPGNMEAFTDTPVYARTNGYLRKWYVDIGGRVKAGQLLAEIETPEIDQQLREARAQLATAQANYHLASSTAERWKFLLRTDSVSRQETDEKLGDLEAKKATLDASAANVSRLEETQGFQKIYAPFDGVITARNTDIGALINAGSNGQAKELFHMAAIETLRVYVQVPEADSRAAVPGATAELTLAELPGRRFPARIVRTSESIDMNTRTLLVEVDVENRSGLFLPGAYVEVHFKLAAPMRSLTLPVNALLFRAEGMSAATVRDGKVHLQPITIGHDYGDELEVTSGLSRGEQVIVNPPDSLTEGQAVRIASAAAQQEQP